MAGMRDVLIRQYFGVDVPAVWETVTQDLPFLDQEIEKLLASPNSREPYSPPKKSSVADQKDRSCRVFS